MTDLGALRDQPEIVCEVALTSTATRVVDSLTEADLEARDGKNSIRIQPGLRVDVLQATQ